MSFPRWGALRPDNGSTTSRFIAGMTSAAMLVALAALPALATEGDATVPDEVVATEVSPEAESPPTAGTTDPTDPADPAEDAADPGGGAAEPAAPAEGEEAPAEDPAEPAPDPAAEPPAEEPPVAEPPAEEAPAEEAPAAEEPAAADPPAQQPEAPSADALEEPEAVTAPAPAAAREPLAAPEATATGANYISLDFVASEPSSYDHATGGGYYADRTIGVDVVESLEGGDFICGDIVTFLTAVTLDGTQADPTSPRTLQLDYQFLLDSTGQTGVALGPVEDVMFNAGDPGNTGTATVESWTQQHATVETPPYFTPGEVNDLTVMVSGLTGTEQVIIRVDVVISCQFQGEPTGNLQAAITGATVTDPPDGKVPVGNQTVPFKSTEDIVFPARIIVDKVTDPSGSDELFDFRVSAPGSANAPPYSATFQLADATTPWASGDINPSYALIGRTRTIIAGAYTVAELDPLPSAWDFTTATCVDTLTGDVLASGARSLTFDLEESQTVRCTFSNHQNLLVPLTVAKTATGSFDRTYEWEIDKSVDDTRIEVADGDTATFHYTVAVTPDGYTDSGWTVEGIVTIGNPNNVPVPLTGVLDTIPGATCTLDRAAPTSVPAGGEVEVGYSCTFDTMPEYTGTNEVEITFPTTVEYGGRTYVIPTGSATATADYTLDLAGETNRVVTVVDDKTDPLHPVTLGTSDYVEGPFEFTYSLDKDGVPGTCTEYTNTAVIEETEQDDSQTVEVCVGVDLTVTKTATGTYEREYLWTIDKDVDKTLASVPSGGQAEFTYTVTAAPDGYVDSGWTVFGEITVVNPNDWQAITADVTDAFEGGTCSVTGGQDVVIPAGGSVELDYECTFAEPVYEGTNTATATWDAALAFTPTGQASGSALVEASEVSREVHRTITVVDDRTDPENPVTLGTVTADEAGTAVEGQMVGSEGVTVGEPGEFLYTLAKAGEPGTCTDYTNVAVIVETEQSDDQTVRVCTYALPPVSNAAPVGQFDRTYNWTITKLVNGAESASVLADAASESFTYAVTVAQTGVTDSGWRVAGTVEVANPNDWSAIAFTGIVVTLGVPATCTVEGAPGPWSVPAMGTGEWEYSCTIPAQPASYLDNEVTVTLTYDPAVYGGTGTLTTTQGFDLAQVGSTHRTVTVTDTLQTGAPFPATLTATDEAPFTTATFAYPLAFPAPAGGTCQQHPNTATVADGSTALAQDSALAEVCSGTLVKTADPAEGTEVPVGDVISYTITVTNPSGEAQTGQTLVDTAPLGVEVDITSITPAGVYDATARTITWTFDLAAATMANGVMVPGSMVFSYDAEVADTAAGTTLVNTATWVQRNLTDQVSHPVEEAVVEDIEDEEPEEAVAATGADGVGTMGGLALAAILFGGVLVATARRRVTIR